jgi:predicted alpha/beta-hydrolase family hydrolase
MNTPFLDELTAALAKRRMATLRYQFPSMERGRRRLDPPHLCHTTVRAAVNIAGLIGEGLPLFAGGKSFGGRMTSQAAAERPLRGVLGLVFVGFPLHPYGRPGVERAHHLRQVGLPMLFLQGTRDKLAELQVLEPVVESLRPRPVLVRVEDADHDFRLPRRRECSPAAVCAALAESVVAWAGSVAPSG